jgi:endonuclease/exonuclease/phosphatase (EEP) superfamily protein YafD
MLRHFAARFTRIRPRRFFAFGGCLWLFGCAHQPVVSTWEHANHQAPLAVAASDCAELLGAVEPAPLWTSLDAGGEISIAVWNTQKGSGVSWQQELDNLTGEFDLVLLQEFALASEWADDSYLSFAPGFATRDAMTGVATLSQRQPLARCALDAREPVLRTTKATGITEFALSDSDSLVVVNLHAVNFALGMVNFGRQMRDAALAVADHDGPLIVTGDFNTWRGDRINLVNELLAELGLSPVRFDEDNRKKMFGHYLDHIYVRGMDVVDATTRVVTSSDHNPMFVRLKF